MAPLILVDTLILLFTRIGLALACRKLLLVAFSANLRELTTEPLPVPSLPTPTTQPGTPYSDTDDESRHPSPVMQMLELSETPQVLRLNHGKVTPPKRGTRGLGRIARYERSWILLTPGVFFVSVAPKPATYWSLSSVTLQTYSTLGKSSLRKTLTRDRDRSTFQYLFISSSP